MRILGHQWDDPTQPHAYNLGSNLGPEFALGDIGEEDEFWLHGAPVPSGFPTPLLSGCILASDGSVLLRLVLGQITYNPAHCKQSISSTKEGFSYQIRDAAGHVVLQVDTLYSPDTDKLVTWVVGTFFNKHGNIAFKVTRGWVEVTAPESTHARIAQHDRCLPYTETHVDFLGVMVGTRGLINRILRGTFENVEIDLDGAYTTDFHATGCTFWISTGFVGGFNTLLDPPITIGPHGAAKFLADLIHRSTIYEPLEGS